MILHYLDPSAWVKRHFQEEGSEVVNALFAASIDAACCRLGLIEMVATIVRKAHQESLDPSTTEALLDDVRADFSAFRVVPVDEARIVVATELALRHRLRTMDALHLGCAVSLRGEGDVVVVSSDAQLLAASHREGLETLNPASPARA